MRIVSYFTTGLALAVLGACGDSPTESSSRITFAAQLTGGAEVPAVTTQGSGSSEFVLSEDGTSMTFVVNVSNLANVRFAHLHQGAAGANGGVIVNLRLDKVNGAVNGRYAEGTLTGASLVGPLAGQPLSALVSAIQAGNVYVNVHTDNFPTGELRGQLR